MFLVYVVRRKYATPEDREYFDCQNEMMEELMANHCNVERIVSKCPFVVQPHFDIFLQQFE